MVSQPWIFVFCPHVAVASQNLSQQYVADVSNSDLATSLIGCSDLNAALKAYDTISMPRAVSTVKFSRWSIDMAHAKGWKLSGYRLFLKVMSWVMAA